MQPKADVREIKCPFCALVFEVKAGSNPCPECGTIVRIDKHLRLEGADQPASFTTAIYVMIAISILCFFGIVADALLSGSMPKLLIPVGIVVFLVLCFITGFDKGLSTLERVEDAHGVRALGFVIVGTLMLILFLVLNVMNLVRYD